MKNIISLSAVTAVCFNLPVTAQTNPTEIVITAKGQQTLASVAPTSHVITAADIQATQARDVPTLLGHISGVTFRDSGGRGSASGVFIRGASSGQTVVLIDGTRSGSATLGSTELGHLPIDTIDRIEVIKGPLSGLYGADAVGGVIQIFTKQGNQTAIGSASLTTGSNGLIAGGLSLHSGNDKNNFRIGINTEDQDGFDRTDISTDGNQDQDGFKETSITLAGKVMLSENTSAKLNFLRADNEVEFDNLFGPDSGRVAENTLQNTSINLQSVLSEALTWNNTVGLSSDESITKAFNSDISSDRLSLTSQADITLSSDKHLTAGIDYYDEDIETADAFATTERDNTGIFAQFQQNYGNFGWVGNIRYDDNSAYGDDTNASLALNLQLSETTRVTLSYGTAFRAPTFNDLFFPGFGNPALLPEESESVELTFRGQNDSVQWRVSAYDTRIENLIGFDPITFTASNTSKAILRGLELELGTTLAQWYLTGNLNLLSAEDDNTGIKLDDRAENTFSLALSRQFNKLAMRFDVYAEKGRHDRKGTELDSYGLFDVSGSYEISPKIKLFANIDNLVDKDYTVNLATTNNRYNTPGRTFKLKATYSF